MATPAIGVRRRARYAFDNSVSKGPTRLIGWLALLSAAVVMTGAAIIVLLDLRPEDADGAISGPEAAWQTLMRAMDAGGVGADSGWAFRLIMLLVTFGGLFIVSTLIGVLTTGIEGRLEELRKGRSVVIENDHTLIVGWSAKIFTVISEIAVANANVSRGRIVVLADRDKVEMEDEIRDAVGDRLGRTQVICRSGNPLSTVDLTIASPSTARSIVVLSPDGDLTDRFVLRALLALSDPEVRPAGANHIVGTVAERPTRAVADLIGAGDVRLIDTSDLIARITAQTCRQSGLSSVYVELLDFDGVEIYFHDAPDQVGRTYADVQMAFATSTVIGLRTAAGLVELNPLPTRVITTDDTLVVIAEDDDTTVASAVASAVDVDAIVAPPMGEGADPEDDLDAEHTVLLGWNPRADIILGQLDAYVPSGSTAQIISNDPTVAERAALLQTSLANLSLEARVADPTRRDVLSTLDLDRVDHVILLAEDAAGSVDEADTDTLVSLLHLRDMAAADGLAFSIVTEVLDPRNRALMRSTSADDFIVSDQLVSLLMAQVSEHADLADVFEDLFDPDGSEIYLKPAARYVRDDRAVTFATVVRAAAERRETAIGYRLAAHAADAELAYGVVVNPDKSVPVLLGPDDRVIVLAED